MDYDSEMDDEEVSDDEDEIHIVISDMKIDCTLP